MASPGVVRKWSGTTHASNLAYVCNPLLNSSLGCQVWRFFGNGSPGPSPDPRLPLAAALGTGTLAAARYMGGARAAAPAPAAGLRPGRPPLGAGGKLPGAPPVRFVRPSRDRLLLRRDGRLRSRRAHKASLSLFSPFIMDDHHKRGLLSLAYQTNVPARRTKPSPHPGWMFDATVVVVLIVTIVGYLTA